MVRLRSPRSKIGNHSRSIRSHHRSSTRLTRFSRSSVRIVSVGALLAVLSCFVNVGIWKDTPHWLLSPWALMSALGLREKQLPVPRKVSTRLSSTPATSLDKLESLYEEWRAIEKEADQLRTSLNATDCTPLVHKILPNAWKRTCASSFGADAITVVTQLGANRLDRLLIEARYWDGPVSAAIYVTNTDDITKLISFWKSTTESDESSMKSENGTHSGLRHISIHVVMEYMDPRIPENLGKKISSFGYPHNIMRNAALDNCDSDYFATFDADFITFSGAHDKLQKSIRANNDDLIRRMRENSTLLVLAPFDTLDDQLSRLPNTREEALNSIISNFTESQMRDLEQSSPEAKGDKIYPIYMYRFPPGHRATNFSKWMQLNETDSNDTWYDIEYETQFEPYVIGHLDRNQVRRYHEPFRGYGFDKASWILEMHCHGYKFVVLRDMIAMHLYHPVHERKDVFKFSDLNKPFFRDFARDLKKKYPECEALNRSFF